VMVAAPAYLKRRGRPKVPADLERHTCITFGAGTAPNVWHLRAGERSAEVQVTGRLQVNDFDIMKESARAALGIAAIPEFMCRGELDGGTLEAVLGEWRSDTVPVQALVPTARHLSPKVVAFVDLLRERIDLSSM
jgi:DNA-binding transcriptional LysR family regulator